MPMSMEKNFLTRVPQKNGDSPDNGKQESPQEKQRQALGIPAELKEKPVLYLGSHRGAFSTQYPSHVAEFQKIMQGGAMAGTDKESAYVDLSQSSSEQVVELLRSVLLRADPSAEGKMLPPQSGENAPLPQYIANVIFLPALDANGRANEPSQTFAIDPGNYQALLPRLADFLKQKGIVTQPRPAIEDKREE